MNYYSKQQCLDMDWNNKKVITAKELAYCIHQHGINTVLQTRIDAVMPEITKLQKQTQQELERKAIEALLATYEYIYDGTLFGKVGDTLVDYTLDPNLFYTLEEAEFALNELSSCWNQEMIRTVEYDHTYKNNNHSRDLQRLQESMNKIRQQYVSLGGIGADFDKFEASLPKPNKRTLKQYIDEKRESITRDFITIGVSHTRAKKIAIAITTQLHMSL